MLTRPSSCALLLATFALATACASEDPKEDPTGGTGGTGATGGAGTGGTPLTGPASGDVTRYDYAFDLTTFDFTSGLSINVAAPGGDCFDVGCRLEALERVQWNGGSPASATISSEQLHACGEAVGPGPTLQIGTEGEVPLGTFLGLDVGFSRITNMAGGQFTYLLSWVGGCDHFGPCDSDPSKLSEFHFEITHPSDSVVLCPGTLAVDAGVTRCDVAGTLGPTYSAFALASDPLWQRTPFTTAAGVDLVFYEVPGGGIAASLDPISVGEYMDWITGLLGPAPYGSELRFAGAPTFWLGFEHPANIILYEGLGTLTTDYADTAMHVLMHEIAHQWAGDQTTLAAAEDFVWKEATAEYLAYVFEDEHRPLGEASASRTYWDTVSLFSEHYPRPTDDPPPPVHLFYGDAYGPGPMVLYVQLETIFGRTVVLDAIKAFLSTPGARSVADLRGALETASGQDLAAYFDAWVNGAGVPEWPALNVSFTQVGPDVTVTVAQENTSGRLYGCIVEVEIVGATQTARALVDFGLAPTSATASATVPFPEQALSTTLDPDHRLVARDVSTMPIAPPAPKRVWIF